jgi:N-acetylglutamate synthase/N-acetylornithine aminotransferase
MTFETDWTGASGAIDRSQQLSAALAAAARVLADSVARDAGGAETPGSVSEHVVTLRGATDDLARVLENLAGQIADMEQRNILIGVAEEGAHTRRAAEAVAALRTAAETTRHVSTLMSESRQPLLDLALTDEAESVVWDLYE